MRRPLDLNPIKSSSPLQSLQEKSLMCSKTHVEAALEQWSVH
ncbi:hypothetical protein ACP4OV_029452 [Aristida adscensionis]